MRIIYITKTNLRTQNKPNTIVELATKMKDKGHTVVVLSMSKHFCKAQNSESAEGVQMVELPVFCMNKLPFLGNIVARVFFLVLSYVWLARHYDAFDVVHFDEATGFWIPRKLPIAQVVSLENKTENKSFLGEKLSILRQKLYEKRIFHSCHEIVTTCLDLLENVKKIDHSFLEKSSLIPIGIDVKSDMKSQGDEDVLLYIGDISADKGLNNLIAAMKYVRKDVKLVLIGAGEDQKMLESIVVSKGLIGRVFFAGDLGQEAINEWIGLSFAVIDPALFAPCIFNLLYANACGKPVLVSNLRNIRPFIKHRYNGILMNPYNVTTMAEHINSLKLGAENTLNMGENGRKMAQNNHSWDSVTDKMVGIYEKAIAQSQKNDKTFFVYMLIFLKRVWLNKNMQLDF